MPEHVSSVKSYVGIFLALLVLTGITVWVAELDLGAANDVVALVIAVTKGTLVVLFFMHVKYSTRLTKLTVIGAFLWLILLIGITLSDYASRGASDRVRGAPPEQPMQPIAGEIGDPGVR